jgi:predicted DNA-binding transcriptional regulator AlpA
MIDPYLTSSEVRRIAGNKSRATIWRWVQARIFPAPEKTGPNSIGWRSSRIEEWAEDPGKWRENHSEETEQ